MVFMICLCLPVVGVVVKRVGFGKEEWCVVVAAFVVSFFRRFPRVPLGVLLGMSVRLLLALLAGDHSFSQIPVHKALTCSKGQSAGRGSSVGEESLDAKNKMFRSDPLPREVK